jgi:hypothetical protein
MDIVNDLIAPVLTPRPTDFDKTVSLLGSFCSTILAVQVEVEGPICKECGYEVGSIDAKNCWYCDPNYEPTDAQLFSHSEAAYEQIAASRERDREALRLKR